MIPQFDNILLESAVLWLDNKITTAGGAFINQSSLLYKQSDGARPQIAYASPYKGWVYNSCTTGANIPSGVYNASGQFLTRASGITFDFNNGRVLSTANWGAALSGNYARKEYNVYVSDEETTDFYLESLKGNNQDLSYTQTGVAPYSFAAPCVIVTNAYTENQPWSFGGTEASSRTLRLYAIGNQPYNQEALGGLITDSARSYFPLITDTDMPLTFYGDLKSPPYSYCDLTARYGCRDVFVKKAYSYKLSNRANQSMYFTVTIFELDLEVIRRPRA